MFFCELEAASQRKTPRYFHTLQKLETTKVELMKQLGEGPELVWPLQLLGTVGLVRALQIGTIRNFPGVTSRDELSRSHFPGDNIIPGWWFGTCFFSIDWDVHHPN
jgi:hypothetical protein